MQGIKPCRGTKASFRRSDTEKPRLKAMKKQTAKYLKGLLPWLALGPVTGILAEGVFRNLREGNTGLSCLYLVALSFTTCDFLFLGGSLIGSLL